MAASAVLHTEMERKDSAILANMTVVMTMIVCNLRHAPTGVQILPHMTVMMTMIVCNLRHAPKGVQFLLNMTVIMARFQRRNRRIGSHPSRTLPPCADFPRSRHRASHPRMATNRTKRQE